MSLLAILFWVIANCMRGDLAALLKDREVGSEGSGNSFVVGGCGCVIDAVE